MAQPRLAVPPQLRRPAEVGTAPLLPLRGVCAREQGAGWAAGEGGKQVAPMLQLAAVSSATLGPQPLGLQPPRKQELCAAPERPDAVPAIGEVGEAEPEKARAREGSCCGFLRTSGRPVPPSAVPAARTPAAANKSPNPSGGPLGIRPCPRLPLPQPSALPGGPAYLREAACPGERGRIAGAGTRDEAAEPPAPWHSRRRREPLAAFGFPRPGVRAAARPQGAWEKAATAAPPHRTVQRLAAPARARARPQLRRRTPGRWR